MEPIISMFIDDEMDIDTKIDFVGKVHHDKLFMDETVDLLRQEKRIRSQVVEQIPSAGFKTRKTAGFPMLRYAGITTAAMAASVLLIFFLMPFIHPEKGEAASHRFVIYQPGAVSAEITGDFTEWQAVGMDRIGKSDYWEITINLPKGEHRFSYIINGYERVADPTVLVREQDDFGGENSILTIKT